MPRSSSAVVQGQDEYTSEAQAMADYLLEQGCAPERIHLEDKATSTAENLHFSMAVMRTLGYDRRKRRWSWCPITST